MQMSQSLANRTADFIHHYPPFTYLSYEEVVSLSAHVKVRYYAEGDFVFRAGDDGSQTFFLLQKGQVEVLGEDEAGDERVIDLCDQGDLFGVRSMLTEANCVASARATGDCLVLAIPRGPFIELTKKNPDLALFFASGYAAGMTVVREGAHDFARARKSLTSHHNNAHTFREEDVIVMKPVEEVAFCTPKNTVQEAAEIMAEYRIGSLVVANENLRPLGIITSTDYTRKVGTGQVSIDAPVTELMSSPVMTVAKGITVAKVILQMMKNTIRHLVVTEDGTSRSRFIGIVSEHDVLLTQGNNPAVLVKRMQKARHAEELADVRNRAEELIYSYLEQEVSIEFITGTMTEINDVLIKRAIELSIEKLKQKGKPQPKLTFAWMNLGSEGRGEQLLRTDQDNALIYQDPTPEIAEYAQQYFLTLGTAVTDILEQCGFAHCPGEIMASNPKWNQPLSGWKKTFSRWIRTPDSKSLMHGTIFFDYRPGYGDKGLTDALGQHLFQEMQDMSNFMTHFAQNALGNPPPLSFLKNFIVERGGKHKDAFDIKLRGMMPLCDAARVLMLYHQTTDINNTAERYEKLAELEPQNAKLFQEAAMAYELMVRYRALNGFQYGNSGRYINPDDLNKIERQTLKYAFRTIEELQSILKTRFSLGLFSQ